MHIEARMQEDTHGDVVTYNRLSDELQREHARVKELEARVAELEAQRSLPSLERSTLDSDRLRAVFALSSALLVIHDLPTVVQSVVHEAVGLFPGCSGALLFLQDENDMLRLQATHSGHVPYVAIHPGQSSVGRVFLSPRSMLMVGPMLDEMLLELDQVQQEALRELVEPWPPTSALLAPVRAEGQRLGALMLYGGSNAHLLHPRDLPFVQSLADLLAVAISDHLSSARASALQRDLAASKSQHAEARAQLDTAQAQLLQSAKLAAVGELAASIAHEINNPLYAARNSLYLVEQEIGEQEQARQFLGIAQEELGRISGIIERMRDFYRPSRHELAQTSVNHLISETLELVQTHLRHGHVQAQADLAPDLPDVTAHADQLRQVFLNLILNACDAMENGGTLRLSTTYEPGGPLGTGHIRIEIQDTGSGITLEHLQHVFEPFYTTKAQGTGLGLAISAHIVTQHGGTIDVDSKPGEGTTFTVCLPVTS